MCSGCAPRHLLVPPWSLSACFSRKAVTCKSILGIYDMVFPVVLVVKNLLPSAGDLRDCRFDQWVEKIPWRRSPEEAMATHSGILAWTMPWIEEPGESYGCKELDMAKVTLHILTNMCVCVCVCIGSFTFLLLRITFTW